jgi:hypothetical protein
MPLMKGAFVVFNSAIPVPTSLVIFQFNSEMLARKVEPPRENQPVSGSDAKGAQGAAHQTHQPTESLTVAIELDAADALASGDPIATAVGLHPALAQLELLCYPPSALLLVNKALVLAGISVVAPSFTPVVLFVWGTTRVLPVKVSSVQITEQQFDDRLNPITAKVDVGLTVLQEEDLQPPFSTLAMVTHVAKEGLALVGTAQSASNITSLLPF